MELLVTIKNKLYCVFISTSDIGCNIISKQLIRAEILNIK
jgi:hypothetical protein